MEIKTEAREVVDVGAIANEIKAKLNGVDRVLTKAQKAMDLNVDALGRLINKKEQLVEGLSAAKIKMGQYVDELGNVHIAADKYVADLNRIEQALGSKPEIVFVPDEGN